MRLLVLGANGIAGFMDFGVGALIICLMSLAFDIHLPEWYLLIGGILALLPDSDIILPIIEGNQSEIGDHHQTLAHRPIIMLSLVMMMGILVGGLFWTTTAATCVFWHYVHDTRGFGGGGIAWGWPFFEKYWSPLYGAEEPSRTPPDHQELLGEIWLRPSRLALCEITIGMISLMIAMRLASVPVVVGGTLLFLIFLGMVLVWIGYWLLKTKS